MNVNKKFFTEDDFDEMINSIERLEPYRVRAYIEYQMGFNLESPINWLQGLRNRLLGRGYIEPENMNVLLDESDGLFGSHSSTSNLPQIDAAFMVVEGNINQQARLNEEGAFKKSENVFRSRLTNSAKSLFCHLAEKSEIVKRHSKESQELFCKRVCEKYGLDYKDKIRQEMSNVENHFSKKNIDIIEKEIIIKIDEKDGKKIIDQIKKKKALSDKNLYG